MPTKTISEKSNVSVDASKLFDQKVNEFEKLLGNRSHTFFPYSAVTSGKEGSFTILTGFFHYEGEEISEE